jgi:hypothetical protein
MTTDIFIKTYHKDFVWLPYCLKSIHKFASGFRNIVIVSDNDNHKIPDEYLIPNCKVYYVDLPVKRPSNVEHGLGYLWQQYIKLTWYNYSDADAVLITDSDEMFTVPITPDSFKKDGKFTWHFGEWSKAGTGICWRPSTDFVLGITTKYNAMAISGFILQKETSIALKNYVCSLHSTDSIWDTFVKYNMPTASEFNIFGSFIVHSDSLEYTKVFNYNRENCINFSILKAWSWGGLSDEDKKKREEILNA